LGELVNRELRGLAHAIGAQHVENDVAAKRHTPEHARSAGVPVARVPLGRR